MSQEVVQLPTNRAEARAKGMTRYNTGKPCKHGHYADRTVASGSCIECVRLASRSWAKRQPKKRFAEYTRKHRAKKSGAPLSDARTRDYRRLVGQMRKFFGSRLVLVGDLPPSGHPVLCRCDTHGEVELWRNNLARGRGCPKCSYFARRSSTEEFIARAADVHGDKYDYSATQYVRAASKVSILCPTHGVFRQSPNKHLSGQGCPSCGTSTPRWETDLSEALRIAGFEVVQNTRILDRQEIDIYLPERKFGIELHGLHWHTERARHKNYHHDKWALADSMGIRLIQVFEDEWNNKQEIVLKRIDAMLGRAPTYAARKCTVRVVDSPEAREFMERTHIQGATRHGVHYGLDYGGRLVAVASFCPKRGGSLTPTGEPGAWEVLRYASEGRVRGGFSRLMKAFVRDHGPEELISYCDLRYGDGGLYRACGFQLDGLSQPDYWWVPDGRVERVPRYKTQKHKLKDIPELALHCQPGMSERQVCQAAGWERIFGVGSQRWIWRSKNAVV